MKLLNLSPASFVGEDIELSLMLLANYTSNTNLRGETRQLSEAYQKLGLLSSIAAKVKEAHQSLFFFQGQNEERKRVFYSEDSKEAKKVRNYLKHWILTTAHKGLLTYTKTKQKKGPSKASAERRLNVNPINLHWEPFAKRCLETMLQQCIDGHPRFTGFNRKFLERFQDRFCFDEAALERLTQPDEEESLTESELENLPLDELQAHLEVQALETPSQVSPAAQEPPRKRPRGRPRKKPLPEVPPPIASTAQVKEKRKRGRPAGSRNKKPRGHARALGQDAPERRIASQPLPSAIFDADDEDLPYAVSERFPTF